MGKRCVLQINRFYFQLIRATSFSLILVAAFLSIQNRDRRPASFNSDKSVSQTINDPGRGFQGKSVNGHLISITAASVPPELQAVRRPITLHAVITVNRHVAQHDYAWIFPDEFQIIDGSSVGTVPELHPGQQFEIKITLERGDAPNRPVVLHVYKLINSEPRGTIAQYDFPDTAKDKPNSLKAPSQAIDHSDESYVR